MTPVNSLFSLDQSQRWHSLFKYTVMPLNYSVFQNVLQPKFFATKKITKCNLMLTMLNIVIFFGEKQLNITEYYECLVMQLDNPIPNNDFTILYSLGIILLSFSYQIISHQKQNTLAFQTFISYGRKKFYNLGPRAPAHYSSWHFENDCKMILGKFFEFHFGSHETINRL